MLCKAPTTRKSVTKNSKIIAEASTNLKAAPVPQPETLLQEEGELSAVAEDGFPAIGKHLDMRPADLSTPLSCLSIKEDNLSNPLSCLPIKEDNLQRKDPPQQSGSTLNSPGFTPTEFERTTAPSTVKSVCETSTVFADVDEEIESHGQSVLGVADVSGVCASSCYAEMEKDDSSLDSDQPFESKYTTFFHDDLLPPSQAKKEKFHLKENDEEDLPPWMIPIDHVSSKRTDPETGLPNHEFSVYSGDDCKNIESVNLSDRQCLYLIELNFWMRRF